MKNHVRFALIAISALSLIGIGSAQQLPVNATDRERQLADRVRTLEDRLAALEARLPAAPTPAAPPSTTAEPVLPTVASGPSPDQHSSTGDSLSLPGFAAGTTINFLLDGYYEYNFNRPGGRVNLLRPYDPTSNSFTLNQGAIVVERVPDPAEGRRFGVRLDLLFGQTTESLAGNTANELRTAPYRNIFQAYGTYVFPVGKGLNVDFGRFASSLGFEGTFAKDQINYSRSLLFTALPFYHMGFRTSYKVSDKATATWTLVNGINQQEDFNGFKSNHFMLATTPAKNFGWTASYYIGQESRDLNPPALSNLPPALPTQPGFSTDYLYPRPTGRTHIADTYVTWNATPKLTLVGEGDYIVTRSFSNSSPTHLTGFAAYSKYQLSPAFSFAGRYEYVSDRGGFLSGATQALKEATVTAAYQPADGFQIRWEFRHDYSNHAFFLTETPGLLKKEQNTAGLGLLWWFGGKQSSW